MAIPLEDEIFYPESDGQPMAGTELHLEEMVYVWQALKDRFEAEADVFVGANLFLYYRKGDRSAVVAPDGFVVKGVPKLLPGNRRRRKYLLWAEGKVPCFVLETTSESTCSEDENKKGDLREAGRGGVFPVRSAWGIPEPTASGSSSGGRPVPPGPAEFGRVSP